MKGILGYTEDDVVSSDFLGDCSFCVKLFLRATDKKGRVHILQISLDGTYPNHPPSISVDVPYLFNLKWSINSRLKDVIQQFQKHLEKLQDFWNLMDDIDHFLLVSDLRYPQRALSHRQLYISNECSIILSIDANDPTSLPEFDPVAAIC